MKQKLTIIKVGGAVVEDEQQLAQLLKDFSAIEGRKVLVHGGGRRATKIGAQLGIESQMVNGRRITDAQTLEVVTMVYGGLVNKNLVARLQANGVNALGLTGADMNVIRSHKRPIKDGIDFGFVGDVEQADGKMLHTLIEAIASETAKALAPYYDVTLIYAFEKPGVLSNPDDDSSVIPVITRESYRQFVAEGVISGGMMPKIENALAAIEAGVDRIVITRATDINHQKGTIVTA